MLAASAPRAWSWSSLPNMRYLSRTGPPVYRIILHRGLTILNLPALAQFLSKLDELNQK